MKTVRKAVVTGGAGFIGSHIIDELVRRGIEAIAIDNLTTGSKANLARHHRNKSVRLILGDVKDISQLLHDVKDIDVVFHEAAIISVPRSVREPTVVHEVNVNSTLKVLEFCRQTNVPKLVFASSAAVYGLLKRAPAREDQVCSPNSPYGAGKLAVENYLSAYHRTYGLETVALRYFNVYGRRQKLSDYSGVITIFINNLLRGRRPLIYGDGNQSRDFVHVTDIVQANMLAMESKAAGGEVFNVASNETTTILRLLEILKGVMGKGDVKPTFAPPREGDVKIGAASIIKIRNLLAYFPKVQLREGLEDLVKHLTEEQSDRQIHREDSSRNKRE